MAAFEWCLSSRGVQLTNPFYSIWATDVGTELAVSLIFEATTIWCVFVFRGVFKGDAFFSALV